MAVKLRLARRGRKKRPFYHIVVADARAPRDGKFIEKIGSYNPMTNPATIEIDRDKAYEWLTKGAKPTYTVNAILRFKGVLYKKHLQRGVSKGALSQEKADQLLAEWIEKKESTIAEGFAAEAKKKLDFLKKVSGESKEIVKETAEEEDKEAFREDAKDENSAEEVVAEEASTEETVKPEAPATEEKAEAEEEKDTPASTEASTEEDS